MIVVEGGVGGVVVGDGVGYSTRLVTVVVLVIRLDW